MGIDPTRVIQIGQPMQGNNSCKKKGHKKKAEKLSKAKRGNQELVSNIDTHAFTLKENHRSLRGEMSKET